MARYTDAVCRLCRREGIKPVSYTHLDVYKRQTENRELGTENCLLDSSPFRRTTTIMRNRRRVLNGTHFDSGRGQRAHG